MEDIPVDHEGILAHTIVKRAVTMNVALTSTLILFAVLFIIFFHLSRRFGVVDL